MRQDDFEMAHYVLVGIARAVKAGQGFWAKAEETARLSGLEPTSRSWQFPSG
jgi:hypothetical protein